MSFEPNSSAPRAFIADTVTFDEGLRRHMINVYNNMMFGLIVTAIMAFFTAHNAFLQTALYGVSPDAPYARPHLTGFGLLVTFAPLAFVMVLSFGIRRLSASTAHLLFYAFSATMGLSLSSIFWVYTQTSITEVFFVTATMFAATSLYGYTTKRDLTRMGSFLFMGLIGILLASLVNFFFHSGMLQLMISVISVIVFTGLTAYDTQKIRTMYSESWGVESNTKLAIMGALSLYLDFINLFLTMLRLFGNRRN